MTYVNETSDGDDTGREDVEPGNAAEKAADSNDADDDIEVLRDELTELNTKWLRALADLENLKKRVERERRRWRIEAKEEVILPLLDVIDNFERAVTCDVPNAPEPDDPYRQGVEMILKHLREVLEAQGVTAIETCGADFDPNLHEAVQMIESGNHRSNEVVEELQRGYRMGERLLRCSRVVVAR